MKTKIKLYKYTYRNTNINQCEHDKKKILISEWTTIPNVYFYCNFAELIDVTAREIEIDELNLPSEKE